MPQQSTSATVADLPLTVNLKCFDSLAGSLRVAVAVSGGSDSMALLRLVLEWAKTQNPSPQIFALTVDHALRAASEVEAAQVAQWCNLLGIRHQILQWHGPKPKTGIQAKARNVRYDLMTAWCEKNQVTVLLTGHTADDQAETVLMRQARTNSARSLAGIWPALQWNGVRVVRAMLGERRQDLRKYLATIDQKWIDDPSNDDERFERVRVRKQLPQGDVAALTARATMARQDTQQLNDEVATWFTRHGRIDDHGCVWLERLAFCNSPLALRIAVLRQAIMVAGDGNVVAPSALASVDQWLAHRTNGRRTLGGAIVMVRRDRLLVAREAGRIGLEPQCVPDSGEIVWDDRFRVIAPAGSLVASAGVFDAALRLDKVPLAVQMALPMVKLTDGQLILANKSATNSISAIFCERKPK